MFSPTSKNQRPPANPPTFRATCAASPLARKNDENPEIVVRLQLVVNGWEIINAYSELIDPIDQAQRFDQQMTARKAGDEEAMLKDDEYVEAMEYGMPPISGWGMGMERLLTLLTKQPNLKDVVLFPLMKPTEPTDE
ncbi:MAG: amino acid--tRNA ligase-related protein [Candidatus Falkowbacteria bacterium]